MITFTTKWLNGPDGPKIFYTDKRIQIYDFAIQDLEELNKKLNHPFHNPGVYILHGEGDEGYKTYVGESGTPYHRIRKHVQDGRKTFAERVTIIMSQHEQRPFTKTDIQFLERKLIQIVKSSGYSNDNNSPGQGVPPTPIQVMELEEEIEVIIAGLKSIGLDIDRPMESKLFRDDFDTTKEFETSVEVYTTPRNSDKRIVGLFHPASKSITIPKGTKFKSGTKPSSGNMLLMNRVLINGATNDEKINWTGTIEDFEIEYLDTFVYNRPSAAGYLIKGGHNSGWFIWKTVSNDRPIDDYRKQK